MKKRANDELIDAPWTEALSSSSSSSSEAAAGAAGKESSLRLAMAHDGRSLALGAMGDWAGAAESSRRALTAAGLTGAAFGADVPTGALNAGLRAGLRAFIHTTTRWPRPLDTPELISSSSLLNSTLFQASHS